MKQCKYHHNRFTALFPGPPIFGSAAITLGIGPHSSSNYSELPARLDNIMHITIHVEKVDCPFTSTALQCKGFKMKNKLRIRMYLITAAEYNTKIKAKFSKTKLCAMK